MDSRFVLVCVFAVCGLMDAEGCRLALISLTPVEAILIFIQHLRLERTPEIWTEWLFSAPTHILMNRSKRVLTLNPADSLSGVSWTNSHPRSERAAAHSSSLKCHPAHRLIQSHLSQTQKQTRLHLERNRQTDREWERRERERSQTWLKLYSANTSLGKHGDLRGEW